MYYSFRFLSVVYFAAAIIGAISIMAGFNIGAYFFKPMLEPILILYIFAKFKNLDHPMLPLLIVALFFSFLGDIFTMIDYEKKIFALLAICTFTVAQVCYGVLYYFSSTNRPSNPVKLSQRWPEFGSLVLLVIAIIYLYPFFEDFKIVGLIYSIISSITIILALNRRFHVSFKSFVTVFSGVICFFLSDLLIVYYWTYENSFYFGSTEFIYALGHWLIVRGMCLQIMDENAQENFVPSL